ncbi:MAG: DUF732 domain-containing protein [Lawsonella sp.]|uniref:DUF732 domain-containing protein n=1 Tax=Lawsonella sp. TaxID=2041415 RepID=UPI002A760026|nr:DUF732 domain-containing protein [Lawsonella sp.]MDY2979305.1 DUF732 domain-containing protein [Lawsonella sp.]
MTNPPRPSRPDQPGQPGRPADPNRPADSSRPATPSRPAAAGRPGRAPVQRIGGSTGAAGRGDGAAQRPPRPARPTASRGAAWGKVGGAGAATRGGAGQRGPAQRVSGFRGQVQGGGAQRGAAQSSNPRSVNPQSPKAQGGKRKGLAAFFVSGALANKRTYLIIGAIVLVLIIVIAAVASQHSSSNNAASTVTAITSTTVAGENRTSAPDAEALTGDKAVTPDLSGLAMDPNSDPNAKAYFAALKKGGIPVKDGMETALLGMGYMHCQAKKSNDHRTDEVQDVMLESLVQVTPGVTKAKAKKVLYGASDKHLCKSLQKRQ